MRRMVGTSSLVLALILPAVAASQQTSGGVAAGTSSETLVCAAGVSRQEAEHARARVWSARDAAARIGR
jgi:hypothetical protein